MAFAYGVYLLCLFTSLACAIMLWRGYRRSRTKMLLWSSLCFGGLLINNLFLIVDMILIKEIDFSLWRHGTMFASVTTLVVGFIWDGVCQEPRRRAP